MTDNKIEEFEKRVKALHSCDGSTYCKVLLEILKYFKDNKQIGVTK